MIKFILFLVGGVCLAQAQGNETSKVQFGCYPSLRETYAQFEANEDTVTAKIISPRGYKSLTQFEGPISPELLPMVRMQFESLVELDSEVKFYWKKSECQVDKKNQVINCEGIGSSSVPSIIPHSLTTIEVVEKVKGQTYEKRKFRITVSKDSDVFFLVTTSPKEKCI